MIKKKFKMMGCTFFL